MGDLTKNISRSEFKCQCGLCGLSVPDYELVCVLQETCDHFADELGVEKAILTINSGNRCEAHNKAEGGAPSSRHTYPYLFAADFRIGGVHEDRVADYLETKYPDKYGIGRYKGRTHIDVRSTRARWDTR